MKAVVYEQFGQPPQVQNVADPAADGARRGHQGRGDRALPQRLARLDGARSRHHGCRMCPATNWPARSRQSAARSRDGAPATASPCRSSAAAAIASSAIRATTRSASTSSSPASPPGARSPNMSRSTSPTPISSGCRDELDYATAASLGCRFVTSFRAIVDQGRVRPGEWVAVHGCGGVGFRRS